MAKADLKEVRCHKCKKLLCKVEQEALRPGKLVEIKCHGCNVMNYSIGADETA